RMTTWRHTATVVQPRVSWGLLRRTARWTKWRISAGAGEEALYRAGIFKAGTSKRAIARSLTSGRPRAKLTATGTLKAKTRTIELDWAGRRAGALPYANVELEELPEILVRDGSEEQLDFVPPAAMGEIEMVDAIATIWAEGNTRALTGAEPERHQRLIAATRA